MPTLTSLTVRAFTTRNGAPPVVFSHGWALSSDMWGKPDDVSRIAGLTRGCKMTGAGSSLHLGARFSFMLRTHVEAGWENRTDSPHLPILVRPVPR